MKAVLQFNLPEDQLSFDVASQAPDLIKALRTFQAWLYEMKEGQHKKLDRRSLQAIEAEFRGVLADFDIFLEE